MRFDKVVYYILNNVAETDKMSTRMLFLNQIILFVFIM